MVDDNRCGFCYFITDNVRILAHFSSGFCQDCQDIWYPFGSGHPESDRGMDFMVECEVGVRGVGTP